MARKRADILPAQRRVDEEDHTDLPLAVREHLRLHARVAAPVTDPLSVELRAPEEPGIPLLRREVVGAIGIGELEALHLAGHASFRIRTP